VVPAHPAERLSVLALDRLDEVSARARRILETNTEGVTAFLAARPELACEPVAAGMIAFPRLLKGDVEPLCALLRDRFETTVVPGRFFGAPGHFRMAWGHEPEEVAEGLARLGQALDAAE